MSTGGWCVDDVGRLVALVDRLDHRSESARASGGEGGGWRRRSLLSLTGANDKFLACKSSSASRSKTLRYTKPCDPSISSLPISRSARRSGLRMAERLCERRGGIERRGVWRGGGYGEEGVLSVEVMGVV